MTEETVHFIDPDGGWFELHDPPKYYVEIGESGRFNSVFEFVTDPSYGMDGDILRGEAKAGPNDIEIPIEVRGTTESEFLTNFRALRYALNPKRGVGKLRYCMADGTIRYLNCHLDSMPVAEPPDKGGGLNWRKFVATFTTHDPYWYDPLETERVWMGTSMDNPQLVMNEGEENAWPIWDFRGPFSDITLFNETTVQQIFVTYAVAAWEHIYVDTRPGQHKMLFQHSTNVAKYRTINSELFPLVPGANKLTFLMTASDSTSFVKCRWVKRYGGV